ncbi:MAG: ABC transporter permease subunit [Chloroflexi bacterium]|nr:ABC transporter permease subunit [Chloroflexota bacterium]
MSLALFRTTLKLSQWAVGAWSAFLLLYGLLIMLLFPSLRESALPLEEYMRSLPEGMLNAIGLTEAVLDEMFGAGGISLAGFLGQEYLTWWPLIAGIYAFMFGAGAVAREAERGTIELLFSHPLTRLQLVVSKFTSFLAIVAMLVVTTAVGIGAGVLAIGEQLDMLRLSLAIAQGGLVVTAIAAYSFLLSCLLLDPRKAMAVAGGLMAAMYLLSLLGPLLDPFSWLTKLSLFYYFRPLEVLVRGEFALSSVLVYVGVTAACLVAAMVVFQRRNAVL